MFRPDFYTAMMDQNNTDGSLVLHTFWQHVLAFLQTGLNNPTAKVLSILHDSEFNNNSFRDHISELHTWRFVPGDVVKGSNKMDVEHCNTVGVMFCVDNLENCR